jgi:hypothetical protein
MGDRDISKTTHSWITVASKKLKIFLSILSWMKRKTQFTNVRKCSKDNTKIDIFSTEHIHEKRKISTKQPNLTPQINRIN